MKPQTIGRVLGIGMRVAGRLASQRLAGSGQAGAGGPAASRPVTIQGVGGPVDPRTGGRKTGRATGNVARGVGAFLRPFRQVGGKLWLEVTGVFFLLPVVVFGPTLWHARASYSHGPDHRTFLVSAAVVVVFLYLGLSSFWRAWRK
ncbi:MAG TPA: hypothetical protein VF865_06140 [Acidobacteriaceae bacterium]